MRAIGAMMVHPCGRRRQPIFAEPRHVGRPNIGDKDTFLALVSEILDRRWLTNNGPVVQEFERLIADYLGVRHVVAVCNGTIGLELAIRAADLTGEVIVPSFTFISTAHAVYWQGLTPIFADIDPVSHCLDPGSVQRLITPRTSGIVATHIWGKPTDTDALAHVAERHNLGLMYDAAHAFGVSRGGRMIGNFGACEVFSFHATKFLNSFEGGAITTNDDTLAERLRLMRNFGFAGYDSVIYPGTNGKMTEVCAAMGLVNLDNIDRLIEINRRNYLAYESGLVDIPGLSLFRFDANEHNNFQYVVAEVWPDFGASRDAVIEALHAEQVLARRYFWPGCHRMQPYRDLFPWADDRLTMSNAVAERVIVLPTGESMSEDDVAAVCEIIRAATSWRSQPDALLKSSTND